MAWVDPPTRATGDLITAAIWNQDVVANMESAPHLIQESISGGDVASVVFSSIPATPFRHLELRGMVRTSQAVAISSVAIRLNGDTGATYASQSIYGITNVPGSSAVDTQTSAIVAEAAGNTATANRVGIFTAKIHDFARSNWHKMIVANAGVVPNATVADWRSSQFVYVWKSTAVINSITILSLSGNIKAGSLFSLYLVP